MDPIHSLKEEQVCNKEAHPFKEKNKTDSVFLSIVQVLLMVQKSGYNQLRLVVFPTIDMEHDSL